MKRHELPRLKRHRPIDNHVVDKCKCKKGMERSVELRRIAEGS